MIGKPLKRFEDERLLTGRGRFTDDIVFPGQAFAAFVRSPHAHADIRAIDTSAAKALPGVLGVWCAGDLAAAGIGPLASGISSGRMAEYPNRDGSLMAEPSSSALAVNRVRHVGEAVAVVLARTRVLAEEAAEAVAVDYAPRPSVTGAADAVASGAPELWENVSGNLCFDYVAGDEKAVVNALNAAAHVISLKALNNRIVPSFLEPRAAVALHDPERGRYELHVGCQSIHGIRRQLARALDVEPGRVRVVSRDVGGAFGARSVFYPEYPVVAWLAKLLARPIKWTGNRTEEFCSTTQGRDTILSGALALDRDGRFLALRAESLANLGARHAGNGPFSIIRNFERLLSGVYDIPAIAVNIKGMFTNTVPVSSYRGVGRMEAIFLLERLIDRAARETGIDRVALRRRNLISPSAMPHRTAIGALYDSGTYERNMDIALEAARWSAFPERRAESARRDRLRGIGLANYIEGAGGVPGEYAVVSIADDGKVTIGAGCVAQGQGHETTLRQIAAGELGIPIERVEVSESDTDLIRDGVGTNASRSMVRAGTALVGAIRAAVEKGKSAAARLLQAAPEDVNFADGRYRVAGTDRSIGLFEVARADADAPTAGGWSADYRNDGDAVTYPNGCHVCEVEIDPETGAITVVSMVAVDDVGRALNSAIVHGQSQGGMAQGIGQALMEQGVYDRASGQILTGSFLDYAMPRAAHLPSMRPILNDVPSPTNPLGVKGAGEGGATGAPAAVMNAVLDALSPLGIAELDMPATPHGVWQALQRAGRTRG